MVMRSAYVWVSSASMAVGGDNLGLHVDQWKLKQRCIESRSLYNLYGDRNKNKT